MHEFDLNHGNTANNNKQSVIIHRYYYRYACKCLETYALAYQYCQDRRFITLDWQLPLLQTLVLTTVIANCNYYCYFTRVAFVAGHVEVFKLQNANYEIAASALDV